MSFFLRNLFKFIAKYFFLVRKVLSKLKNTYRIFPETFWSVLKAYEDFDFEGNHRGVLYDRASSNLKKKLYFQIYVFYIIFWVLRKII